MSMLQSILDGITAVFSNDTAVSIIFGLVISLAGTQFLKFRIPVPQSLRDEYVWFIRLVSLPLGFFPTFYTWPGKNRLWVALTVSLAAPFVYKLAVAVLYWKWPTLEARLSAPNPNESKERCGPSAS